MRLTPEIIAGMQQLALDQRALLGDRAPWHVGDVAWGVRQHEGREDEWTIRLWRDGDRVVAWSWLKGDRALLELDVHPAHRHLLDEILDVPDAQAAVAFDDDEEARAALARHGFVNPGAGAPCERPRAIPAAPEPPPLPDGFRCRTVEAGDLAERVAIHRDVWAPSRVTESSYANVMAAWPYRSSLDCVVEAPDGRFAAYVLAWPDDENGVGRASNRSACATSFAAAGSARPSARSRSAVSTRRAASARDRDVRERAGVRALRIRRLPAPGDARRVLAVNRLAQETSPYLLQHAENPVDWYAVGR